MALVAYGNSDSSDYEDDDNDSNSANLSDNKNLDQDKSNVYREQSSIENDKIKDDEPEENLFNELPKPTSGKTMIIVEEDDEFLHKKASPAMAMKPKPKIMIPSLSDFKDVENTIPATKPKATNGKKSGLLNILPQPKNGLTSTAKSFIPNVLTQKPLTSSVKKKESLPSAKVATKTTSSLIEYSDDSDDEIQNDFFSINKPVEVIPDDVPFDVQENSNEVAQPHTSKTPRGIESYFKKEEDNATIPHESEEISIEPIETNNIQESSSNEMVLDEEAILKLCGSRGKRKREEIQIVDVNQQEVLNDARQMLLKGLMEDTSKRQSASKKRGNEPTSQQRRKHQITYLAHQAKANEIELQNQWASNRMTKRKTQSKYGF